MRALTQAAMIALCLALISPVMAADPPTEPSEPITQLKELHLTTTLARGGEPVAAVVAPADGRYEQAVGVVLAAIEEAGGCALPVIDDSAAPEEILRDRPVIALGNMATSDFIHTLYRQYYTFLDLQYPGEGGHVVRSLHDPYATGQNIILIGGSDDAGVLAAAEAFAAGLEPADPLEIGRTWEIQLGEDLTPPDVGEQEYTWRDSWRELPNGTDIGYDPNTYFGWNPISTQAALYYMTGEEKYLREYLRLALPDPENIPKELSSCYAFARADCDLEHPLIGTYHYRAHLQEFMYDLIEESPLLDDETRLRITNEMLARQEFLDENARQVFFEADLEAPPPPGTSRHGLYDGLSIYSGSRYFAKYYPSERWDMRLAKLRHAMSWWLEHATWGELDTLGWINTSTEPVVEYWQIEDPRAFVESGVARRMMRALEILWTGAPAETANAQQSISLMHRATWLLEDGRYAWMARQAEYDFDLFRIGQSWWPSPEMEVAPPDDLDRRVMAMTLPGPRARAVDAPFPADEGYQYLSYRTGISPADGYFMLDGFNGGGRNPHHVSALWLLRMGVEEPGAVEGGFSGWTSDLLLRGYANQATVLRDGLAENHVAKAARLDATHEVSTLAHVRSTVPDAAFSEWTRDLLWLDDRVLVVSDLISAREAGQFDLSVGWEPTQNIRPRDDGRGCVLHSGNNSTIVSARPMRWEYSSGKLFERTMATLQEAESERLISAVYRDSETSAFDYELESLGPDAARVTGEMTAVVSFGEAQLGDYEALADAVVVGERRLAMLGGRELAGPAGSLIAADTPVSIDWRLDDASAQIEAADAATLRMRLAAGAQVSVDGEPVETAAEGQMTAVELSPGSHVLTGARPAEALTDAVAAILAIPAVEMAAAAAAEGVADGEAWPERWQAEVGGSVTAILPMEDGGAWVAAAIPADDDEDAPPTGMLTRLAADGEVTVTREVPGEVNALAWAEQRATLLAGGEDDVLRAFSAEGELLWEGESRVSEHYRTGDGWYAPWFTDPERRWGIDSLMVADLGDGPEIILGRTSTMEFWSLDGELIERTPVSYGSLESMALLERADAPPQIIAGQWQGGMDHVSILTHERKVRSNSGFHALPEGSTRMRQWQQRGVREVAATDLDGTPGDEVVVARSGHWNDVRMFDADQSVRWQRSFGPADPNSRFVADVSVRGADGDAGIVVGLQSGRAMLIETDGEIAWSCAFGRPVGAVLALPEGAAVGLTDGRVHLIDDTGEIVQTAELGSAVDLLRVAETDERLILAGTRDGEVYALEAR
ncbi:MAG: hypothetical protein ACQER1_17785 [Armatimonadota bacterium]